MEPKYTVYCHTHIASGRRYVGVTKYTMMHRWNQHCAQAMRSKDGRWHFPNAIRKYGKDAFRHYIIEVWNSLEKANEREKYWIKKWDLRNPEKGFNLAIGGDHLPHPIRKNPWNDPEYRAKQLARPSPINTPEARANNKAALNTPESKIKQSTASREIHSRPGMKEKLSAASSGRVFGPEARAHMSIAQKGRVANPETREKLRMLMFGNKRSLGHKWTSETRLKVTNALEKVREQINCKNRRYVTENGCITHKICHVHGLVPISDCHVGKYEKGNPRIECRLCMRQYNMRSKRKRKS